MKKLNLKYMKYAFLIVIAFIMNIKGAVGQALLETDNRSKNAYGEIYDDSQKEMWGESNNNNSSPYSGSGSARPFTPDDPGATCVPVPEGTYLLLGFGLVYGILMLYKRKREKVN